MKVDLPETYAYRMINLGVVVLVTSKYKDRTNVMAATWNMPLSHQPPLVGVAIHKQHLTHDLIQRGQEFVLNIPGRPLAEKVLRCGQLSGWNVEDKLAAVGLNPGDPKYVEVPIIEECLGHIECALVEAYDAGDHTIFVGQVVAAQVEEEAFDLASWVWKLEDEELNPLPHLGGRFFAKLDSRFVAEPSAS